MGGDVVVTEAYTNTWYVHTLLALLDRVVSVRLVDRSNVQEIPWKC
jgi:hypothetical protein